MFQSATQDAAQSILGVLAMSVAAVICIGAVVIGVIMFFRGVVNSPHLVLGWGVAAFLVFTLIAAALIPTFSTALTVGAVAGAIMAVIVALSEE